MDLSARITVLYVDDELPNLFLFKASFNSKYNVITAPSGFEALELLQKHEGEISVVISDMKMPIMNGVELITKAKEHYANLRYFILTGYQFNEEIEEAQNSKLIHQWFTKPINRELVEEAIDEVVSH